MTFHFQDGGEEPQAGQEIGVVNSLPTHCYQLSPESSLPYSAPPLPLTSPQSPQDFQLRWSGPWDPIWLSQQTQGQSEPCDRK